MGEDKLPSRAEELIKGFVEFHDRVKYYLDATEQQEDRSSGHVAWITQLCAPTYADVVVLLEDAQSVYTSPVFIRLLFRDNTFKDIRDHNGRFLVDALERRSPREVLDKLFKHLDKLTAEDRARSFLLLASEAPASEANEDEENLHVEKLDRIVASFEASPRALRPQLLIAASIIGHEPMVTLVLRDIAANGELAPNIDAVEAECLIEAATNQHFSIVEILLAGGRFSNGNEMRWDAVVQALKVSCTTGSTDITEILLPPYLSYCSVISACGAHHPRLLRLALSNWHYEIVALLLECDPRGTLCNMKELVDTLREEAAQKTPNLTEEEPGAAPSGFAAVVVGEDSGDMGEVMMWDAAALAWGVSSGNTTLVRFLVNHVAFCREALAAALARAEDHRNFQLVEVITTKLQKMAEQFGNVEEERDWEDQLMASSPSANLLYPEKATAETPTDKDQQLQRCVTGICELRKPNDDLLDPTRVREMPPNETYSVSIDSLVAVRTASIGTVEYVISCARQSIVLTRVDTCRNEFVQASPEENAEINSETEMQTDSLTTPQLLADVFPTTTMALVRSFASTVVDNILSEGQARVAQPNVEAYADPRAHADRLTYAIQLSFRDPVMVGCLDENPIHDSESPPPEIATPSTEFMPVKKHFPNCDQQSPVECANQEQEERADQGGLDETNVLDEVRGESLSSPDNDGVVAQPNDATAEFVATVENCCDQCDPIVLTDRASENEVDKDNGAIKLAGGDTAEVLFPIATLHSDLQNDVEAVGGERVPEMMESSLAAHLENTIDTERRACEHSCSSMVQAPVSRTQSNMNSNSSVSPTRATIICPVKWEERSMGTREASSPAIDTGGQLREGDRVEVHYKGQAVLSPGTILFCHSNGACDVVYEDGEEESCVPRELIQLVECAQAISCNDLQNHNEENQELGASDEQTSSRRQLEGRQDCSDNVKDDLRIRRSANEVGDTWKSSVGPSSKDTHSAGSLVLPSHEEISTRDTQCYQPDSRNIHSQSDIQTSPSFVNDKRLSSTSNDGMPISQLYSDHVVVIENLLEIPSMIVPSTELERSSVNHKVAGNEIRAATGTSQRRLKDRWAVLPSQGSRCRTTDTVSSEEVAEWKNVDLLLNRKRRFFQSQTGSIESIKLPWGEEFATIQSLKRFAVQHPDILRAHIETQLRGLDGPLLSQSPGKPRSPRVTNASVHSGADQARESLLLMKDLAFLLQHRLAPFFGAILAVVMPTVFCAEKRFLCETVTEVLDAIILHCSGRKLALVFLQLGETYSTYDDLRLYNLTSVYVEKCIRNWSKSEVDGLHSSQSSTGLLTMLTKSLASQSVPVRISTQRSFRHLRGELGTRNFGAALRAHVPADLVSLALKECGDTVAGLPKRSNRKKSSRRREAEKQAETQSSTIVQSSPSILQRMLLQRQNRVLPAET
ncbi:hypothetical protein PHYPSEUDO_006373 [Phytophthora pseudosyringae]|uniref:Tudor domain-containing protein n=1 Tax=Phytophthora pseudosyringae TaxID=221518 RepID=A0A8T1WGX1_9STRA|nr:hypothetical protein PHYPSEUDO_006373 [Phytophthora pseudosyringae]